MRNLLLPVLLACVLPAQAGQEPAADPPPTYEALAGEFAQARKEHNAALRAATEAQDKEEVTRLRGANPAVAFTARFAAGAKAHAGKPEAVPFLCWLTSNARAP